LSRYSSGSHSYMIEAMWKLGGVRTMVNNSSEIRCKSGE
jgi:hypothetical protein